ncbi:MAG: DUF4111 domain-containing protein [Anaerolineales bacterium]|nr:MAG: DUF4111 domain-containing protein [Anaerolineales bacterium]
MSQFTASDPGVDVVVQDLLEAVKDALGENFFGLYLYGSLATGGFVPSRSDIDFLVISRTGLTEAEIERLEEAHQRLWNSGSKWAAKLEGKYLPLEQLKRNDPAAPPVPTVNEGQYYLDREGVDWVFQRHVLIEHETIVEGPSLKPYIDPVSTRDLQTAIGELLEGWWAPMLANPKRLTSPGYPAYAVLSMCRALYLLEFGTIASKEQASSWVKSSQPSKWASLITGAFQWEEGDPDGPLDETRAFIEYTVERGREVLGQV